MEKIYLFLILLFFILAFALKNITTYLSTKQSIRGKSLKLTLSIVFSTLIYILILFRLSFVKPKWIGEINLSQYSLFNTTGLLLVSIGFVLGILALIAMRNSWRVGIKYDQKTELVTTGIYKYSRNPYFFSYDVLILGYIFIFPSIVLIALYIPLVIIFHRMILEEEKYLETVHKEAYLSYKKTTGRYIRL